MFIAIDVGNTSILFGVMDRDNIYFSSRLSTDSHKTSDEYAVVLRDLLHIHKISTAEIEGGIISSVVPVMKKIMSDAAFAITGKRCLIVGPGVRNGLKIRIDNPAQLGSDEVCDAVAAVHEYPQPTIIVDMDTATTFSVLDKDGNYLGGMIMPGMRLSMEALSQKASLLPDISLEGYTKSVIGKNTEDCIKNGIVYGNAAMLDGIIDRITEEIGMEPAVVTTGEAAALIGRVCRHKLIFDRNLLLKGLREIYLKNQKERQSGKR